MIYIYCLRDPRTNEIRYVGKTETPRKRWREHRYLRGLDTYREHWIAQLLNLGLDPIMEILEEVPADVDWVAREKHWIALGRELDWRLTNLSDGGESGVDGFHHTEETKKRLSELKRGAGNGMYGKTHTDEIKRLIGIASVRTWTGRKHTEEAKAKMSAAKLGGIHTDSHRLHQSLSQMRRFGKVTIESVRAIRKLREQGMKLRVLAERFDVSIGTIGDIVHCRTYEWVR